MEITVLSLGGSIIAPDKVDTAFLKEFKSSIINYLQENDEGALILVCGGGAPARVYQNAFYSINDNPQLGEADWLGIRATHLNAELVKAIFGEYASPSIVIDPTSEIEFSGRILVAAGWKPGFSTDTDAVYLAKRYGAKRVINLSNIAKVYTDDPKKNPDATPIDTISWEDFIKMVGTEWKPGLNAPFDPIASKLAKENNIEVICADGRNIKNTIAILEHQEFFGTLIH